MSHANARLTVHGRALLVDRVLSGRPAAHVAKELGVSRQCAHRWIRRYQHEGAAGLRDRSSKPHHSPSKTLAELEDKVVQSRQGLRSGPARIAAVTGVPERTVSRILRRHQIPHLAYAEIHADEKGVTAAGVLRRAAAFFATQGIPRIERILSDNAFAYRNSIASKQAVADIGAEQRFIKPHCPWTNGKVERLNRTLQSEWAYKQIFTSNTERAAALEPWLNYYNNERIHTGIGTTPINRVSPT